MTQIKAGIIGATGYAGAELVRILLGHPNVKIEALSSVSFEGKSFAEIYPNFSQICDDTLVSVEQAIDRCDVLFAAVPHGVSQELAKQCDQKGKAFIDIGADFRLDDPQEYEHWYGCTYQYPQLHQKAVYGLCEIFREQICQTRLIGNPGCYPTSISLGLYPALKGKWISPQTIIIDAKSGTTGAGRKLAQNTHFPDCNEAFAPYNIGKHRHTPEIEQTLSKIYGQPIQVTFVPHLLPVNRGIVSTIYASMEEGATLKKIHQAYVQAYQNEKFVRVKPLGEVANLKYVRMSNYCDISLHADEHTNRLIIVAAIDNLVKGAAGQAVQNMNLIFGLPEETGLHFVPASF